jgi:hypothetical protein
VFLHGRKGLGKKDKKVDDVTRFWYTLKNLHLVVLGSHATISNFEMPLNPI